MKLDRTSGLIEEADYHGSENCDERPIGSIPEAIIIHCISLPPGEYGGSQVTDFFCNQLDSSAHDYFAEIKHLRVSAHFFIRRDAALVQFVPTHLRAWHAGESLCLGRPVVNDFSIGIELEGLDTDSDGFSKAQYAKLNELIECLQAAYPKINTGHIFAHSDIAPGRKPDPGPYFDWKRLNLLKPLNS